MAKVGRKCLDLPPEILLEVFRYLTAEEKASVRATCKYLQQLVDHPSLWLFNTVILQNIKSCDSHFWRTLKKRKIRAVDIKKATQTDLQKLVCLLPDLIAVTINAKLKPEQLHSLSSLAKLQKLQLSNSELILNQELLLELGTFKQLTHLVLCSSEFCPEISLWHLVKLKQLRVLVLQYTLDQLSLSSLRYILFRLPRLRALSLCNIDMRSDLSLCFTPPDVEDCKEMGCNDFEPLCIARLQLDKLSVLDSINQPLSEAALKQLSTVRSLSASCSWLRVYSKRNFVHSLLENLPHVSDLDLSWTGPFEEYAKLMPSQLESLNLTSSRLSDVDMQFLSKSSGKSLRHLNIALCSGVTETMLKLLPEQFPSLRTLDLSGCSLLKEDILLGFTKLPLLNQVTISHGPHPTASAIKHFLALTDNRVQLELLMERTCFKSQSCSCGSCNNTLSKCEAQPNGCSSLRC
ncbi:uncharacterized protein im:7136021 isoform X2 [Callorhinchus milii]|uniref:uncharacterized protein im:7136021 isoform X2 n=1 Tax=Callorhinchus milii TaxID=7868 RepID=UPI000457185E|nr:uncharacterized protein im:7136021 isoform X2 [Callorhinchus milii]|eukprot:gi/632971065/ref/XP_007901989.1/ PREDICTED: uncharacterized protein LOC103185351 isoform X2 [Callorhinchus milii]